VRRGRAVDWKVRQRDDDLVEGEPDSLRDPDEGDPAQHIPAIAALVAEGSLSPDEADPFVVANRRWSEPASLRDVADREQILWHQPSPLYIGLDINVTLTFTMSSRDRIELRGGGRMPVAIVTGASRGLGRALALDLASDGWTVVIDGRRTGLLEEAREQIGSEGSRVRAVPGDVADPSHRQELVATARALGSLDLLVNNASTLGTSPLPTLYHYSLEELRHVMEVNVIAPLALFQESADLLRDSGGTVLAISSDAATEPYEGWGGYGASKAALDQLHRILEVEEPSLKVYSFDPGDMRTEMHQAAFPGEDISDRPEPETVVPSIRRLLASGAPSGRYRVTEWSS
jgi:NAD(P)-dependent dehydrogenase (short-subunit alcohol dehydrogenase family)